MVEQHEEYMKEVEYYLQYFAKARADYKVMEKSFAEMDGQTTQLDAKKFPERIQLLAEKDMQLWKRAEIICLELNESTNDTFRYKVADIFKEVFVKMTSKTVQLPVESTTRWGGRYKICISRDGFALRRNIQATPLSKGDIWTVLKMGDQVEKALRTMKEDKWADKFKEFLSVVPAESEGFNGESIVLDLEKPIFIPNDFAYSTNSTKLPMIAVKAIMHKNYGGIRIDLLDDIGRSIELRVATSEFDSSKYALIYAQLHTQLPALVAKQEALAKPIIEKANKAIKELNDKFSRELLLAGI